MDGKNSLEIHKRAEERKRGKRYSWAGMYANQKRNNMQKKIAVFFLQPINTKWQEDTAKSTYFEMQFKLCAVSNVCVM